MGTPKTLTQAIEQAFSEAKVSDYSDSLIQMIVLHVNDYLNQGLGVQFLLAETEREEHMIQELVLQWSMKSKNSVSK